MKSLIILLAVPALLGAQAHAADMSQPVYATKAPLMAAPVAGTWQGFYIGLDGGYGWGGSSIGVGSTSAQTCTSNVAGLCAAAFPNSIPLIQPFANPSPAGFLFGGHAGYNWQYGNVVAGLEVDYLGANMTDSQTVPVAVPVIPQLGPLPAGACALAGITCSASQTLSTKIDALASGRARLGYALNDIFMFYGTGGIAWEHGEATYSTANSLTVSAPPSSLTLSNATSRTDFANSFGWVLGGGAEMKLMSNILVRAQFLHYDFGDVSYFGNAINAKTTVNALTGGIGYKF
jgi:outer membrane immunogenic protein